MTLSPVQPSDNQALAVLIRAAFPEHDAPMEGTVYSDPTTDNLYELFRAEGAALWVARIQEEIVGCCGVYPTEGLPAGCAELVKFYIKKSGRGQGIGSALLRQSIQSALALGYRQLYLESLPHFAKAVSMYQRLGFRKLDHPLGSSGHPGCNIWMLKDLESSIDGLTTNQFL